MSDTIVLTQSEVERLLTMKEAIDSVEKAFAEHASGRTQMLQRSYLLMEENDGRVGFMPAYISGLGGAGVKIVSAFHDNPAKFGLPSIIAMIVLNDPITGKTLAVMDGTYITMIRTGAVGAIAAKYLSRRESKRVGIVGTGVQGRAQLMGLVEVRGISEVFAYNRTASRAKTYAEEMRRKLHIEVVPVSDIAEAVRGVDILATCTPSSEPIVNDGWVEPGLHINSVGPSTPGKQEISDQTYLRSKLVVDDYSQTSRIGGISTPVSRGILKRENVHAELGELILGKKTSRTSSEEVTVFVSSGLSIQDVAVARIVYEKANKEGIGRAINFLK